MHNQLKGFEDLEVFQRAYKVSLEVHSICQEMPKEEQYRGIADQLRRCSKGICANLAEGFGKQHVSKQEFRRYISIAIGSANEVRVWIRYALDLGYIAPVQWEYFKQEYLEIAKMLSGLYKRWT